METLSRQDILDISTSIVQLLSQNSDETCTNKKDTVVVEVEHKRQPRVFTKKKEDYIKVQTQNKPSLSPSYEIQSPVKDRMKKKLGLEVEQPEYDEKDLVKCSICGEYFYPTSKINTVCSNKTCKLINKYDKVAEKHTKLRQEELLKSKEK